MKKTHAKVTQYYNKQFGFYCICSDALDGDPGYIRVSEYVDVELLAIEPDPIAAHFKQAKAEKVARLSRELAALEVEA
jgi:hypothetical protein